MDELKACPFCGQTEARRINNGRGWYYVYCDNCRAESADDLGESGANEGWNTRPVEDALRAQLSEANDLIAEQHAAMERLTRQVNEASARVASLERTIIEADACYNVDRQPTTIEAAELALVQMAGYGRDALDNEVELKAIIDEQAETIVNFAYSDLETCTWREDEDGTWHTSCEASFGFEDGGPADNGALFCHHCGKRIAAVKYQEESEAAK